MGDKTVTEALSRLQLNDNETVLEALERLQQVISRFLFFHEGTKAEYDRAMTERNLITAIVTKYDLPLSASVSEWKAFEDPPSVQPSSVGISNFAPLPVSQPAPVAAQETSTPTNLMEEVD